MSAKITKLSTTQMPLFFGILIAIFIFSLFTFNLKDASASFTISRPSTNNLGLVGHWTFDGADVTDKVYDKSGQGNHGYFYNGATTTAKVPGKIGQALKFDGVNDQITVPDNASLNIISSITVSAWVYHETQTKYEGVVSKFAGSANLNSYLLYVSNTGKPAFLITSGGANYHNDGANNTDAVPLNQWSYMVGTFDGRYVKIYRDGVLKHTEDTGSSRTIDSTAQPVWIGRYSGTQFFDGLIDEVRIYNRALSAKEVKSLYNQSASKFNKSPTNTLTAGLVGYWTFDGADTNFTTNTVTDKSGNGNNGTMTNMSTTTARAPGKIGQALRFDGVNDYYRTADINALDSNYLSISQWVFINEPNAQSKYIFSKQDGSGPNDNGISLITYNNKFRFDFYDTTITKLNNLYSNTSLGKSWYHVVTTYDGTYWRIYVNGALDNTPVIADYSPATSQIFTIGKISYSASGYINSFIDEVRIYNRALSAGEVKMLYNMGR